MAQRPHRHPCQHCKTPVECGGEWEQNIDGWPEVICREFHMEGGFTNPDFLCEDCADKAEQQARSDLLENV